MLSSSKQRAKEREIALNMSAPHKYHFNQEPPSYSNHGNGNGPSKIRSLQSAGSQGSGNGDYVKPELPAFLQNMGPGISPLKQNPPITVSWLNVRAVAPPKQNFLVRKVRGLLGKEVARPKELLKGVNGIVKSGQMCAIMGARYASVVDGNHFQSLL